MLGKLTSRVALAVAAVAALVVACNFSADFFIRKTFTDVRATSAQPYAVTQDVDLAAEAPGAWKRRGDLRSLDLVAVELKVTRNYLGNTPTASGTIVLERAGYAGSPVTVGTWTHTLAASPTAEAPDVIDVTMPASGSALVMDAIHGDGTFTVKATGSTNANLEVDLEVLLHVGINYHMSP